MAENNLTQYGVNPQVSKAEAESRSRKQELEEGARSRSRKKEQEAGSGSRSRKKEQEVGAGSRSSLTYTGKPICR